MDREHPYVIFSDLDGTLLDADRYSHHEARPSLEALRSRGVPLVLCTSKTRAEVERARADLGNAHPLIVENGGAIFVPSGYFSFPIPSAGTAGGLEVIRLGQPYATVVAGLLRAAETSGCPIRGFHDMSAREVAVLCRMTLREAERAKSREYDEPFLALTESPAEICGLLAQLDSHGLKWTRGGRFYHVHGRHSKGDAVRILLGFFRCQYADMISVGLGDAPNDVSLLETVDLPIVIPPRRRLSGETWYARHASWRVADRPGPGGWNQAVLGLLKEGLRSVSAALS